MDDLIAFLRARLDEDERIAKAATPGPWRHNPDKHWRKPGTSWFEEAVFAGAGGSDAICVAGTGETDDPQSMADADHIARHDPARVLADVAAKRAILELHHREGDDCGVCCGEEYIEEHWDGEEETVEHVRDAEAHPCRTLRTLALPYADHSDYREEWRP